MEFFLAVCSIIGIAFLISLLVDLLHFLLGLLFSFFPYRKFPHIHFCSIRLLSMSELGAYIVARRCQMDCGKVKCRNWTCPKYGTSVCGCVVTDNDREANV